MRYVGLGRLSPGESVIGKFRGRGAGVNGLKTWLFDPIEAAPTQVGYRILFEDVPWQLGQLCRISRTEDGESIKIEKIDADNEAQPSLTGQ
jgi:hypothetical protein